MFKLPLPTFLLTSSSRHSESFAGPFVWALLLAAADPLRLRGQRPTAGQPPPPPGLWPAASPGPEHLKPAPFHRLKPTIKPEYQLWASACSPWLLPVLCLWTSWGRLQSPETKLLVEHSIHDHILPYSAPHPSSCPASSSQHKLKHAV